MDCRVMPDSDALLPETCLDCGACCFGDGPRYLRLSGVDHDRLGSAGDTLAHFIGNRFYMRVVDGHCAALSVVPTAPRYSCGQYVLRPDACRRLERGSDECLAEFARKHLRVGLDARGNALSVVSDAP